MRFAVVGDVHSHYSALKRLLNRSDIDFALQTGDLGLYRTLKRAKQDPGYVEKHRRLVKSFVEKLRLFQDGKYDLTLPKPVYFVKGTHDDFVMLNYEQDLLRSLNLHYLGQGNVVNIQGITVMGFGGTYTPNERDVYGSTVRKSNKINNITLIESLQTLDTSEHPNRQHKFFTDDEVTYALIKGRKAKIDILLTHSTARGEHNGKELGCTAMRNIIMAAKPTLHFHGCHHLNYNKGIVYGLGNFCKNQDSFRVVEFKNGNLSVVD